jgi:hypothetical protein
MEHINQILIDFKLPSNLYVQGQLNLFFLIICLVEERNMEDIKGKQKLK